MVPALLAVSLCIAQTPDSAIKDSQPPRRVVADNYGILVAMVAASGALIAAPASYLFLHDSVRTGIPPLGYTSTHVTAYFTGGYGWEKPGLGWFDSYNVEFHHRRMFGAVRYDHFNYVDLGFARMTTVSAGYFVHPVRTTAGGVTVGHRWASGHGVEDAVVLGFPLFLGRHGVWGRFEPTYAITRTSALWNYRAQLEVPIPGTPLLAGWNLESRKKLRAHTGYITQTSLLLGFRF